jgi:hypothetical protein
VSFSSRSFLLSSFIESWPIGFGNHVAGSLGLEDVLFSCSLFVEFIGAESRSTTLSILSIAATSSPGALLLLASSLGFGLVSLDDVCQRHVLDI